MMRTPAVLAATDNGGIELLPETPELIWGFVAFALLMAFMFRVVFPRINQTLEARQEAIQGRITDAESAKDEAEQLRRRYEAQLDEARAKADELIAEARESAEAVRREAVARGEAEAAQIVARAREEVAAERDRVLSDLRSQVVALSADLASKIVEHEVDAARHADLVDRYITELSGSN